MSERDKFLTEAMGECWHLFPIHAKMNAVNGTLCAKCARWYDRENCNSFSDWQGFGKLLEEMHQISEQKKRQFIAESEPFDAEFPDRFANTVYSFLKEREQ